MNHLKPSKQIQLRRLADALTVIRATAGLPLILALQAGELTIAWWTLLVGCITDAVDGWCARQAGGGTAWGAWMDPLADKLLILAPLLWLGSSGVLPLWAIWVLLTRELLISGWRSSDYSGAPASAWGKCKTVLQLLSLLLLLLPGHWWFPGNISRLHNLGWLLFWPALLLSLVSAISYLRKSPKLLRYR